MLEFLANISLFPLFLTLGAYWIGLWCRKKWDNPLCNAILIAVILVIVFLAIAGFSIDTYLAGTSWITWLMTPATVALAVPMYGQIKVLKKNLPAILTGVIAGATVALLFILGASMLLGLDDTITISLLPKSVTTAIGIVVSEESGGIPALTSLAIFVTGILGALVGKPMCRILRLDDPISQGVAFGTSAHAIGTYTATEIGALQGAVSSLSLAVAGLFTALIFPLILTLI